MMRSLARKFSYLALSLAMILWFCGPSLAKSIFLIANINASPTPVDAYNIEANGTVTFQKDFSVPFFGGGAVGIALDEYKPAVGLPIRTVFITYEASNTIQLLDGTTMTSLGTTTAPGASNLAGIVMDISKRLLYTVDRTTSNLYVYRWDVSTKTLTLVGGAPKTLGEIGINGAFGIGLDPVKGRLYVANLTDSIPYYNTSDFTKPSQVVPKAGTVVTSGPAINVAVDSFRQLLYSGSGGSGCVFPAAENDYLDQVNLATGAKKRVFLPPPGGSGVGVLGVGVDSDPDSGLVYITTGCQGDELRVYTPALTLKQNVGKPVNSGDPTGLVIGPGVNLLHLNKKGPATVTPPANMTYTLSFDNKLNATDVHNVILKDTLPPQTTFVSATGGGTYDSETHRVTWQIGTLPAGAGTRSVQLVVRVKATTSPGTIITNRSVITSNETPNTTEIWQTTVPSSQFKLTFPLGNYNPFSVPVRAVMDHSVVTTSTAGTSPSTLKFYVKDGKVKAFNGEFGNKLFGAKSLDPNDCCVGYENRDGTPFLADVLNYTGGKYLFFDGHAGYDFAVSKGTIVKATGSGKLFKAKTDPVNGGSFSVYGTFYINHGNGYYSWYLYTNLNKAILSQIDSLGYAVVVRGQNIGSTSGSYLHLDVRKGGTQPENVIDPYKENLWATGTAP
jgi:uncharacterized repeat protein (TIGR01451 family)